MRDPKLIRASSQLAFATAVVLAAGASGGFAYAAHHPSRLSSLSPTSVRTYDVTAGYGDDDFAANAFTPEIVKVYVGDTVRWHAGGLLEPHDVAFGPLRVLGALAAQLQVVTPQKGGPPLVTVGPQVAFPSPRTTYDGTGVAHSGILQKGAGPTSTWSLTFTKPGIYRYYCLFHTDPAASATSMSGVVEVMARPTAAHIYHVTGGYDNGTPRDVADAFFPEDLTIHAGDTVVWSPGGFHTVAFGPPTLITQLRHSLITAVPQHSGPPTLVYNPRIIFPSGGSTYDGMGFVNSGLLIAPKPHTFSLTFTKPGVYKYGCLIHPGMDGVITVLPAGQ
jgi:plastocyanin